MMETKVVFGFDSIKKETPTWAKWMFRSVFILTTAVAFWAAGTSLLAPNTKVELMTALKSFDLVVFGFSKLWGYENPQPHQ